MDLASRLGVNKFYEYLKKFGIGAKTGVQIAGESSGIMMKQNSVKNVDLARIGFGQAIAVTPIQLVSAICTVLNGGYVNTPTIIKDESITKNLNKRAILSKNTSQTINNMLKNVVNKTGEYTFVEGYDVGGKTGTAQKYENGQIARGKYISSFVGTYPATNPEYVMLLLVDEPGAGAYYGSIVAAPYGQQIFSEMFKYMGIKPIESSIEPKYEIMPNVENLSLTEAINMLIKLGISYEIDGEGGKIEKQLPPAGTLINLNNSILLVTN
jgi:stage V sporulation protein D (sporulation-specific penicillin-binding protein)